MAILSPRLVPRRTRVAPMTRQPRWVSLTVPTSSMMPLKIPTSLLRPHVPRHQYILPQTLHRHVAQTEGRGHASGAAPRHGRGRPGTPHDHGRDDGLYLVDQSKVEEGAQEGAAA